MVIFGCCLPLSVCSRLQSLHDNHFGWGVWRSAVPCAGGVLLLCLVRTHSWGCWAYLASQWFFNPFVLDTGKCAVNCCPNRFSVLVCRRTKRNQRTTSPTAGEEANSPSISAITGQGVHLEDIGLTITNALGDGQSLTSGPYEEIPAKPVVYYSLPAEAEPDDYGMVPNPQPAAQEKEQGEVAVTDYA